MKDIKSSWIPSQDNVACFANTRECIGLQKEKGVRVFDGCISPAMTDGEKRSKVLSPTPSEHNFDVALVDSPWQESHPQVRVEDQSMNPDDTVQVSTRRSRGWRRRSQSGERNELSAFSK